MTVLSRAAFVLVALLTFGGCGLVGDAEVAGGAETTSTARASPTPRTAAGPAPTATPTAAATAPSTATADPTAPPFAPTGRTQEATVTRVIDGDTIEVGLAGQRLSVRYIGIDTPETVAPGSPVEWMGPEASAANERLVAGRTVVLERDVSETDHFGRLLRYVWLRDGDDWTLVNLELVALGFAAAATFPPDVRYADLFVAAQAEARDAERGLWGDAPTPAPTRVPTADPAAVPAADCHASYDPCLPIVADLDCPDVRALGKAPVRVSGPDDYRLDRDGDGIGCE